MTDNKCIFDFNKKIFICKRTKTKKCIYENSNCPIFLNKKFEKISHCKNYRAKQELLHGLRSIIDNEFIKLHP